MRKILPLILIAISACNSNQFDKRVSIEVQSNSNDTILGQKIQFQPTGLSSTCDTIIKMLGHPPHGLGSINAGHGWISFDSLQTILRTVRQFDFKNNLCTVFKKNYHDIEVTTWKSQVDSLIIQRWVYYNSQNYEGTEYSDSIKEFYIKDKTGDKEIWLKVSNNNILLNLTIDQSTFTPLYEIILEPTLNTIAKFDSIKKIVTIIITKNRRLETLLLTRVLR